MDWAVLLMAYGGPDSLDDIRPYLLDVRGGRETPEALVEEIRERYALIGGKSPLLEITNAQASALEAELNRQSDGDNYRAFVGMRHWTPYIRETVGEIARAGIRNVVAICMAPYYSKMSIGAYQQKLNEALEAHPGEWNVRMVGAWNDHPLFITSVAEKVRAGLEQFAPADRESAQVIFTAHSLPAAIMQQGDPYAKQFEQTVGLVAAASGLRPGTWHTAYQSAGAAAMKWLGPTLDDTVEKLAEAGTRKILVAPIGFVADHVEILFDIDIETKEEAEKLGVHLERTISPNDSPSFIRALAAIVQEKVSEPIQ